MNEVERLVSHLKQGDEEAFASLYSMFEKSLCNHLYKMLGSQEKAQEVFQETMIKMIKKIEFYESRSDLKNSFKAWLFRIGTNLAIDEIRKSKKASQQIHTEVIQTKDTV